MEELDREVMAKHEDGGDSSCATVRMIHLPRLLIYTPHITRSVPPGMSGRHLSSCLSPIIVLVEPSMIKEESPGMTAMNFTSPCEAGAFQMNHSGLYCTISSNG